MAGHPTYNVSCKHDQILKNERLYGKAGYPTYASYLTYLGTSTSMKTGPKTNAKSHCLDYFPVIFFFPVSYFSLIICLEACSFSKLF